MKSISVLFLAAAALSIVSVAAAGANARIYAPTVKAQARIINDQVRVNLTLVPRYRVSKPGVQVTLTNCRLGQTAPLRVVDYPALMDGNYALSFKPGKLTWKVSRTPARPDTATMKLALALPQGKTGPYFCFHVSMHDSYTHKTKGFDLRVPIPALVGSTVNP